MDQPKTKVINIQSTDYFFAECLYLINEQHVTWTEPGIYFYFRPVRDQDTRDELVVGFVVNELGETHPRFRGQTFKMHWKCFQLPAALVYRIVQEEF